LFSPTIIAATAGPEARPIFDAKPPRAAIWPVVSNSAFMPRRYEIVKAHMIPIVICASQNTEDTQLSAFTELLCKAQVATAVITIAAATGNKRPYFVDIKITSTDPAIATHAATPSESLTNDGVSPANLPMPIE